MTSDQARPSTDSGSFRDREGRVYLHRGRVFRGLSQNALEHFTALRETGFYRRHREAGRIVATRLLSAGDNPLSHDIKTAWAGFLEHEPVPAVTYPYEWTFSMLRSAAELQLQLLEDALNEDFVLKDASPYNIQFVDGMPVFIDVASFEPLRAGQAWEGYRQFCEMFLFPLFLQAYKGVDFQPFLRAGIDGVAVQAASRLLTGRTLFNKGVLSHVRLQAALERRYGGSGMDVKSSLRTAGFNRDMILVNVRKLRKLLGGLEWKHKRSEWSHYAEFHNYSDDDHRQKEAFVGACVQEARPGLTWDVGCNTGQFSAIAARHSDLVLALDVDHLALEYLFADAGRPPNVLPLLQNVLDPSPNWGWRQAERRDLQTRCPPDLLLCLAVVHHAVISGNVPLAEFIDWLAGLTPRLVIEWVSRDDEKVQALLRNREDIYWDYDQAHFEQQLARHFDIRKKLDLDAGRRRLYWCVRAEP